MKLYDGGRAPNPRRVRIFLAEKGITVPIEPVDIGSLQHKSDAYTAINPLQRRINDLLFADVPREDFAALSRFLEQFALNSEYALAEIRRSDRERSAGRRLPRAAGQA